MSVNSDFLIKRFEQFENKFGLIEPEVGSVSQNPARWTNEAARGLVRAIGFANAKNKLTQWSSNLALLEHPSSPGLLMRTPENDGGYESHDNISAMIGFDYLVGTGFSRRFLDRGRTMLVGKIDSFDHEPNSKKRWQTRLTYYPLRIIYPGGIPYVYNNMEPESFHISSFMLKYLQVIAAAKMVVKEELNLIEREWWKTAILSATKSDTQDGWALSANLVMCRDRKYDDLNIVCTQWSHWFKTKSKYRVGGLGQVLAHFWGHADFGNPDYEKAREAHPTIDTLWGDFGDETL